MPNKVKKNTALTEEITTIHEGVSSTKKELNEIDLQKEAWYKKKEEYGQEIVKLIQEVKNSKNKRNQFTKKVKESKSHRQDFASVLKNKIDELKKLKSELKSTSDGKGKPDPFAIKKDIERLESKIETEVMSFDAEKKIMKEINRLKKDFDSSKETITVWKKVRSLSKELDQLRKESNDSHRLVQDHAKHSQVMHETMITNSKKIDDLKKKEEEAYQKFFEFKQKFNHVNDQLKEKLNELKLVNKQVDRVKTDSKKQKRKNENILLKDRESEINEKIKNKEKITTEDFLALQQIEARKSAK